MDVTGNWPRRSSSTRNIYLGRPYDYNELEKFAAAKDNNSPGFKKQSLKALWRKLLKEKRKILEPRVQVKSPYDAQSYMQNFDDGQMLDDEPVQNDLLSRSFSMRFADPSKHFS